MSDPWEAVREAIATKLGTSAGVRAAGLRGCDTRTEERLAGPVGKVLPPFLDGPPRRVNANREEYDLRVAVEFLVPRPAGTQRASPMTSAIVRAVQVEWRTGEALGLGGPGGVVSESWIDAVSRELVEYADTGQDGARVEVVVRCVETFDPPRTA